MNRKLKKECESGCEYILPDYMGDIKKLLISRAKALPTGKFVGEGSVEVSGTVEYEILYVDTDGNLTSVNCSSDYTDSFSVDGERYIDSIEKNRISQLKVRVTGPRKFSVKADVETVLTVAEEINTEVMGDVFSDKEKTVEKCSREIRFSNSVFIKSGEREYAEISERLEGVSADEVEVIAVSAKCSPQEAIVGDGEVTVKGENIVYAVLSLPERPPMKIKKAIPFEEIITAEGANPEMMAVADGFVSSVSIGFGSDGEQVDAVANIIAEYSAELIENTEAQIVTDAYTLECDCKNVYEDRNFSEMLYAGTKKFSVTLKCDKSEERVSDLSDVIYSDAEVKSIGISIVRDGCEIHGEISVNAVGYENNVDGTVSYIPVKMQDSFEEKVNIDCQFSEKTVAECIVSVDDCEITNNGEGLVVKCLVCANIYILENSCVKTLASCESLEGENAVGDASVITVYYPKQGERLFDVAKRYKTTSAKIAEDNALSESVLSSFDSPTSLVGIKKLIIR